MAQLQFKGKQFVQNHHLTVKFHELVPKKSKSLTDPEGKSSTSNGAGKISLHDNLIIHGDNLKALKALLPTYGGKVKCVYIDPPYNTGNEKWAYNDNVNSPMMQEWLGKVVDKEDLTRHDKWLCMMTPRLKLLRELLRDDGVIFISIDDNEQHHLRMLMDEIFGEGNFLAQLVWRKRPNPPNDSRFIGRLHEYILIYRRSDILQNFTKLERLDFSVYSNPDDDLKGDWKKTPLILTDTQARPNLTYEVKSPIGKKFKHSSGWRIEKRLFDELNIKGEIYWGPKGDTTPARKRYLSEDQGVLLNSIVTNYGTTITARKEIKEIFGSLVMETPKPVNLIRALVALSTDKNSIILDSFAGSGTTAHSVLALNKEDGGNRKFVLVEMEDYADKITAERVRRVIKGVPSAKNVGSIVPKGCGTLMQNAKKQNLQSGSTGLSPQWSQRSGLGGTFSYFELGKPIEMKSILSGSDFPTYKELARYVFYTATGEEFDEKAVNEKNSFIGESKEYKVYLFYKPDIEYLKNTALTLDKAKALGKYTNKKRLVFAPTKYLDQEHLEQLRIDFAQLPFEIYKLAE